MARVWAELVQDTHHMVRTVTGLPGAWAQWPLQLVQAGGFVCVSRGQHNMQMLQASSTPSWRCWGAIARVAGCRRQDALLLSVGAGIHSKRQHKQAKAWWLRSVRGIKLLQRQHAARVGTSLDARDTSALPNWQNPCCAVSCCAV